MHLRPLGGARRSTWERQASAWLLPSRAGARRSREVLRPRAIACPLSFQRFSRRRRSVALRIGTRASEGCAPSQPREEFPLAHARSCGNDPLAGARSYGNDPLAHARSYRNDPLAHARSCGNDPRAHACSYGNDPLAHARSYGNRGWCSKTTSGS
ncbi:MAG: hypothetical protein EXS37_04830 [Opitutus sp.]|nr:hypothetical protein [Opitutus sp.]